MNWLNKDSYLPIREFCLNSLGWLIIFPNIWWSVRFFLLPGLDASFPARLRRCILLFAMSSRLLYFLSQTASIHAWVFWNQPLYLREVELDLTYILHMVYLLQTLPVWFHWICRCITKPHSRMCLVTSRSCKRSNITELPPTKWKQTHVPPNWGKKRIYFII